MKAAPAALLGLLLAGCCTEFLPLTSTTLDHARRVPPPEGPCVRRKLRVTIECPWLNGEFTGLLAARTGPAPQVRLQLFPDVGGKVLDLLARPDRISAHLPKTGESVDAEPGASSHPLVFMGVTLLEHLAPIRDRVNGVRHEGDDLWYRVHPVAPGAQVTLLLVPARVARRRFAWPSGAQWEEEIREDGGTVVKGEGFDLRVTLLQSSTEAELPDVLFTWRPPK